MLFINIHIKKEERRNFSLSKNHRLSLCMIVKNEEDCIARCLESVKDVVDEIIIVDTGSTDKTIDICKSYEARIEPFQWNGSFSDARNYSIEKATGDWILWLDADEEVDEMDRKKLCEAAQYNEYDVLTIHLINYYGDYVDTNNSTDISHTRLFRNKGFRFVNKMHERLDIDHVSKEKIGYLDVKVHHYGYLNSIINKKEKTKRNLKMLKQQVKEGENVHWAHYYIALEHYNNKELKQALEYVNMSILAFLKKKALPSSMVYKLKYSILIAMGKFEESLLGIEKVIFLYPDFVDLHFFKGIILYHLEKYDPAIESFKKCLELGEENRSYLILKGVGSFQAYNYLSLCYQKLNKLDKAIWHTLKSLEIAPEYVESRKNLTHLLNKEESLVYKCLEENFEGEHYQKINQIVYDINN